MASDGWNMKSLEPAVRETAREAARRAGLSVAEWLQSVIVESAAEQQADSERSAPAPADNPDPDSPMRSIDARLEALSQQLERLARVGMETAAPEQLAPTRQKDSELTAALRAIESRLAEFTRETSARVEAPAQQMADALAQLERRLDKLTADGRSASSELENRIAAVDRALAAFDRHGAQPPALAEPAPTRPILHVPRDADSTENFAMPAEAETPPVAPELLPLSFDAALAEIAARQQALEDEAPARATSGQPVAPPGHDGAGVHRDFSGIEQQIRHLTHQLESLGGPGGFHDAVATLRQELAEIGRALTEAAPRRAVQALEAEVRALAERVDAGRHRGADGGDLAGIERGLAELRDALQQLAPAESLVEFREDVKALDRKIDEVAAGGDSTVLRQLQQSVAELRQIAARTASGEALIALAEEVQALGDKVERLVVPVGAGAEVLSGLDQRFQELAATFAARVAAAGAVGGPGSHDLVAVIEALAERVERVELARVDVPALDDIAAQLGRLTERLEASGARLDNLDAVERGLSDLYDHIETLHATAAAAAERAGKEAALQVAGASTNATFEVQALKHEFETLRQDQVQNDRRTQETLEAVHGTLERLVDRLAMVETERRDQVPLPSAVVAAMASEPAGPAAAPAQQSIAELKTASALTGQRRLATAPVLAVAQDRRPIDPTLPADHPLEPGTAAPRMRPVSAAERIAASEAALGPANPAPAPQDESKANFIAAARRAAQAAVNMAAPPAPPAEEGRAGVSTLGAIAQKITRRRPLLLGLAILAIAGTLHLVLNVLGSGEPRPADAPRPAASEAAPPAPAPAKGQASVAKPTAAAVAALPTSPPPPPLNIAPPSPPPSSPAREASAAPPTESAASAPAQDSRTTTTVSPLTIASIKLPAGGDVTGSTGRAPGFSLSNAAPPPNIAAAPTGPAASAAIPPGLRAAAADGNPAAAYELGLRHAEGRGVPASLEEAARWFERAAEQGIAPAQYRLGSFYEKGTGVKKDVEKARRLYTAAAEKGSAKAMHNLAVLYAEGLDGKPDFKPASYWFRKAAERGVADSQYNLAILHARGLGVEQNLAESYKWFALAAQQGDADAGKKRDDVAGRLDPQALIAAKLAVQTFTAEPQPDEAVTVKAPAAGWEAVIPAAPRAKSRTGMPAPRKVGAT